MEDSRRIVISGPAVSVLTVDAWNPQARSVVDGDAFAFRRFVTWMREGLLRGGHDAKATWTPDDDDEDEDFDDDEDEDDDDDDDDDDDLDDDEEEDSY